MKKITTTMAAVLLTVWALHLSADEGTIRIGSARIQLRETDRVTGARADEPFVVQFREIPDASRRAALRARGVTLANYVGNGAYVVRCSPACVSWLPDDASVRASSRVSREMKYPPVFETDAGLADRIRRKLPLELDVGFYEGVPFERALEILHEAGIESDQRGFGSRGSITVRLRWMKALELLDSPEVRWVEPSLPEPVPMTINAGERVRADQVREQYDFLGADGTGTKVGIWDWFPETAHTDLEDRVTWVDVNPGDHPHGEYVSGIVAGAGILDHRAKGIAPKAELYWHTCDRRTVWADMREMKQEYGITITNNSWGIPAGWWADVFASIPSWENNTWAMGYYHELAAGADELVRDDDLLVVISGGNHRGYGYLGPHYHSGVPNPEVLRGDTHAPNPDYESVMGAVVAKNVLSVGYVSKDEMVAQGSCWGPTADGRIKPDLVAPGIDLFITDENDGYTMASGSSLSSPVASGSAALLTDYWRRRRGTSPTSLELKNLLIHSARDLGNPGPDYVYGFGLIDDELAARIIDAASASTVKSAPVAFGGSRRHAVRRPEVIPPAPSNAILELGDLDQGQTSSRVFVVGDGSPTLRATLAWYDPPADHLVNDLDLRLVAPNGSIVRPFVLDPSDPAAAASRGRNDVDNVESAVVDHPAAGTWTVVVEGTRVAMAPQRYSLIVSAVAENAPLVIRPEGRCQMFDFFLTKDDESADPITPATRFSTGDPLNVYFSLGFPENADYGDYYGLVSLLATMKNAQGDLITRMRDDTHQVPGIDRIDTVGVAYSIPAGLPAGPYTSTFVIRLRNGRECTASTSFSVE